MISLLFNIMDELLFLFGSEGIIVKSVKMSEVGVGVGDGATNFTVRVSWCVGCHVASSASLSCIAACLLCCSQGEAFDMTKHKQVCMSVSVRLW